MQPLGEALRVDGTVHAIGARASDDATDASPRGGELQTGFIQRGAERGKVLEGDVGNLHSLPRGQVDAACAKTLGQIGGGSQLGRFQVPADDAQSHTEPLAALLDHHRLGLELSDLLS